MCHKPHLRMEDALRWAGLALLLACSPISKHVAVVNGKVKAGILYVCAFIGEDEEREFQCITAEAYMEAVRQPKPEDVSL